VPRDGLLENQHAGEGLWGCTNLIGNSAEDELRRAETVCDFLEAIAQTVCEVVGGVDLPLITCPVMRLVQDAVCSEVPHLGVSVGDILLHAQESLAWLVLAITHGAELLQVVLGSLLGMLTPESGANSFFASTLEFNLVVCSTLVRIRSKPETLQDIPLQWHTYALSSVTRFSASSYLSRSAAEPQGVVV
jgi:hypothetical protein